MAGEGWGEGGTPQGYTKSQPILQMHAAAVRNNLNQHRSLFRLRNFTNRVQTLPLSLLSFIGVLKE